MYTMIGSFAGQHVTPQGEVTTEAAWKSRAREWLPSPEDHAYVESSMGRLVEPGKRASCSK